MNNTEKHNGNTMYMWDDEFYYLVAKSFISFDKYWKELWVKLALILLSNFFKKVTFAISKRKPNGIWLFTRPHLYIRLWVINPV